MLTKILEGFTPVLLCFSCQMTIILLMILFQNLYSTARPMWQLKLGENEMGWKYSSDLWLFPFVSQQVRLWGLVGLLQCWIKQIKDISPKVKTNGSKAYIFILVPISYLKMALLLLIKLLRGKSPAFDQRDLLNFNWNLEDTEYILFTEKITVVK